MNARRKGPDQILISANIAERLLVSLANAEDFGRPESKTRLRAQTQKYWPDLWERAGETSQRSEGRALAILKKVQHYLRRFWRSQDTYERDWLIHRARQWYWRSRVHEIDPDVRRIREEFNSATNADSARSAAERLNVTIDLALDNPPQRAAFEESLFHLQQIAFKTRFCPNPECKNPFFIATKKGQKFCTPECARPSMLASKRQYWKTRREQERGK
jgi:hypothetical protein